MNLTLKYLYRVARLTLVSLSAVGIMVGITACTNAGDLEIVNEGAGGFTVLTGDETVTFEDEAGVLLLNYGCTPGDVTVLFDDGQQIVVEGPVCPDTKIVVGDGAVELRPTGLSR